MISLRKELGQSVDEYLSKMATLDRRTYGELMGQAPNGPTAGSNRSTTATAGRSAQIPQPASAASLPRATADRSARLMTEMISENPSATPLAAPMVRTPLQREGSFSRKVTADDEDEFADADVGALLA